MHKAILVAFVLLPAALSAQNPQPAQTPQPAPAPLAAEHATDAVPATPVVFTSDAGFSFSYPSDWAVIDSKPMMPAIQLKANQDAESDMEKKGIDCTQISLLLRHGSPASSIVVLVLPYGCLSGALSPSDLAATASGIAEGLKKSMDLSDPIYGAYKLGSHDLWIERAQATPKDHPDQPFIIEVVSVMLKKGMVCWMGFARDEAALKALNEAQIVLDGDTPAALVPSTALAQKKP